MNTVPVQIVRFVLEHQPNIVGCILTDAYGRQWEIEDKVAIFTEAYMDAESIYPQPGIVACEIVREWTDPDGSRRCIIDTRQPRGVEAKDGETQFEMFADEIATDGV